MRELLYTILELEGWCSTKMPCSFCVSLKKEDEIVCQIKTRNPITHKLVAIDFACQKCKEKFENDELPKCDRCSRLRVKSDTDFLTGKYVCRCIESGENTEEKELPVLPSEERESTFYERQINTLREEKNHLAVEAKTHLDAMEAFEGWNKEYRQESLDRIKELEAEIERLKKQTPQELVKEIEELKKQVEQLTNQQKAQTEVPPKDNKIKNFFKFGGKK